MTTLIPGAGGIAPDFPGWDLPEGGPAEVAPESRKGGALITVVLDKSGSMEVVREATIAGFNQFKKDQLASGADALVSLSVFDWEPYRICTAVPLAKVADLTHDTYRPDGCTALYDAMAEAIKHTDDLIARKVVEPDRVLVAVITDGEENSSRHYGQKKVFDMVRAHEQSGWTFVYLGANIDSYAASQTVGVRGAARSRDWVHSDEEMRRNMAVFSHATARWRGDLAVDAASPMRAFFTDEDESAADNTDA